MSDYGIKTYDAELGLYVWGVTTYGTSWTILPAPEIH